MDHPDGSGERDAPRLTPAAVVAAWTAPALLSTIQRSASSALSGETVHFWRLAASEWPGWCLWAALTPAIFAVADRFRFRAPRTVPSIVAHAGALAACVTAHALITSAVHLGLGDAGGESFPRSVAMTALAWLPSTAILYAATVGVAFWMQALQRARLRERERAALGVQLARAELDALRSQLHPHFLFNTLNTIAILIREHETDIAARLVTQLGDILRHVLRGARTHETTLREEVALVSTYLEIEQVRFGERLEVVWGVEDDARDAMVPSLVLQPLIENALRHGVGKSTGKGVIEIGARREGTVLSLWVRDNGGGVSTGQTAGSAGGGMGLANTRERLLRLYNGAASLELTAAAAGGTRAEVRLPFRTMP